MDTLALTANNNFEEKYTDEEGTMHEQILKEKDACCNEFQEPVNFEEISRNYQSYVMATFKNDYLLTLEDKINFSTSLALYHGFLHNIEEFFEEECHFTLISWMDKYIQEIKNETADEKVFQLLYNIILIFEIIPIKVADLFELKIFTKLNKIRKYIKNKLYIYHHLDKLINYWTNFCSENYVLYGKKRCRMQEENFPQNSDEDFKNFANPKKKACHEQIKDENINKNNKIIKSVKWNEQNLTNIKLYLFDASPDELNKSKIELSTNCTSKKSKS